MLTKISTHKRKKIYDKLVEYKSTKMCKYLEKYFKQEKKVN